MIWWCITAVECLLCLAVWAGEPVTRAMERTRAGRLLVAAWEVTAWPFRELVYRLFGPRS